MNVSSPTNPRPLTPLKILLIGPPGSRKTTFGLQFPNVYVEDCDRNLNGPERWLRANGLKELSYAYNNVRYEPSGI
jgi:predicted NACHT family NTPase